MKGSFPRIEGYAIGTRTKSHHVKLYINDACWGPKPDSIEYGYRVPFGGIHIFIHKIGGSEPKPYICTDIVKPDRRAQPALVQPGEKHIFIDFMQGKEPAKILHLGERLSSTQVMSSQLERRNQSTSFNTEGLVAIPMATIFRTPMSHRTWLLSSWLAQGRLSVLQRRLRQFLT